MKYLLPATGLALLAYLMIQSHIIQIIFSYLIAYPR
jgi:hypothetical protein